MDAFEHCEDLGGLRDHTGVVQELGVGEIGRDPGWGEVIGLYGVVSTRRKNRSKNRCQWPRIAVHHSPVARRVELLAKPPFSGQDAPIELVARGIGQS